MMIVGAGLLSILTSTSTKALAIGLQVVGAAGYGSVSRQILIQALAHGSPCTQRPVLGNKFCSPSIDEGGG